MSRRHVLRTLGEASVVVWAPQPVMACSQPAASSPYGDDDTLLLAILTQSQPRIEHRTLPYRITRSLKIAPGTTLTIEPGTRIVWAGPTTDPTGVIGVFEATGSDIRIMVLDGGEAFVECALPSPAVYAVLMRGHTDLTIRGIQARECQHVYISAATEDFAQILTQGAGVNVARNIIIQGGGARYSVQQTQTHGACHLRYVVGCVVRGAHYENVAHGIEWWGGNADPQRPPAQGIATNERKCRNLTIEKVLVRNAAGGGIWGSMGQYVMVRDCSVDTCGDVGFDAEGCTAVTFERCIARNAHNGCFTTFFLCDGVRLLDCTGIVDNKAYPLVRIYNDTQSSAENKGFAIVGGHFECLDPSGPGTIDTAMGPVQTFTITGATLRNVRIDLAYFSMHDTRVLKNNLTFPYPLAAIAAIRVGSSKVLATSKGLLPGSSEVCANKISYTALDSNSAAVAISVREDDFNGSATGRIEGNRVSGSFGTGIILSNASANPGIVPSFVVIGNRFAGLAPAAKLLSVSQESPQSRQPAVHWDNAQTRDGRMTRLRDALS